MMEIAKLQSKGLCCACKKTLSKSHQLNLCSVRLPVPWKSPVWGNVLTGEHGYGMACVCDDCLVSQRQVKFLMEFVETSDEIIYHSLEKIRDKFIEGMTLEQKYNLLLQTSNNTDTIIKEQADSIDILKEDRIVLHETLEDLYQALKDARNAIKFCNDPTLLARIDHVLDSYHPNATSL